MSTATARSRSKSIYDVSALEGQDEYTALQNFINYYRDSRPSEHMADSGPKMPAWWQFWKSPPQHTGPVIVPEDWLNTDIRTGLTGHDVDTRRKKFGWNEITTEKVNFFKQFLSYFQGPILYGMRFPVATT